MTDHVCCLVCHEEAIKKINAGAQLVYAIYFMQADKVLDLFKAASNGFVYAYMRACEAYQVGAP